ncbi:MAG: imidazole glycerol phosphate synthase subunit HisH [Opitutae bacterium]|jgi:imidazole glycerol-phosphate synthase subunit HisH|nr:imidazole glycerol phosphate synthase subunit HisH [Opitutae bacterium]
MITIVDYGMGNLGSIQNMLKRIGVPCCVTGELEAISKAEKIILPGVGAFDAAMCRIGERNGLRGVLDQKALVEKIPLLGVCLGMQLLTGSSEEGNLLGLNWIPGKASRFPIQESLKVPHMGWNIAQPTKLTDLTKDLSKGSRYYFVHSYFVTVEDKSNSIMRTNYGIEFDSAIERENIFGVQFHPEKSHRFGMQILKNFSKL